MKIISFQPHQLFSRPIIKTILKKYLGVDFETDTNKVRVYYRTFDNYGIEEAKLKARPSAVLLNNKPA